MRKQHTTIFLHHLLTDPKIRS